MRYIFVILFSLIPFSGFAQKYTLRIDGFYYWTNGRKTIIPIKIPTDISMIIAQIGLHTVGMRVGPVNSNIHPTCYPRGTIPGEGSTFTHYIAFSNQSSGTTTNAACNDITTVIRIINTFVQRGKMADYRYTVERDSLRQLRISNNHIEFRTGDNFYFSETFDGKLLKDGLELKATRDIAPSSGSNYTKIRKYKFCKYGNMPSFE